MTTLSDDINDYCFFDTETRSFPGTEGSDGDVTECGTYRYMKNAAPIMVQYAIGNAPVRVVCRDSWTSDRRLGDAYVHPTDLPEDFLDFRNRAERGEAWFVAWNAAFDREAMKAVGGDAYFKTDMVIDAMAQAVVSNLPPSLDGAAKTLKLSGKVPDGKHLIRMFCPAGGAWPNDNPEDWDTFKRYGLVDVALLREAFMSTRHLTRMEWEEYWANEDINQRGMPIDLPFVEAAAQLADVSREYINEQLAELSGGAVGKVTQVARLARYVDENTTLPLIRDILVKETEEDEDGGVTVTKLGLDRGRIERVLAYLDKEDEERGLTAVDWAIYQMLDLRLYGGSAAPGKFAKMLTQHTGGRVRGQYVFNGANQTGRFSSRGVQVHNLTRSTLGEELEKQFINAVTEAGQ